MILKQAKLSDKQIVNQILKEAQKFQRENGIIQWAEGFPSLKQTEDDILTGNVYLALVENSIVGVFTLIIGEEPTYDKIYEGAWHYNDNYMTIHRFATHKDYKGQGKSKEMLLLAEKLACSKNINYLRIDTHKDNVMMQGAIKRLGYEYAGIIIVEDGTSRFAYEKRLFTVLLS